MLGALGVDVAGLPPGARHARRRRGTRSPTVPREVVGFAGLEALVQPMAGEGDGTPPVHAVFSPRGGTVIRPTFDYLRRGVGRSASSAPGPTRGTDGFLGIVVHGAGARRAWSPRLDVRSEDVDHRRWARCTAAACRRCATTCSAW